jgi:hypothetical protein
MILFIKYSGFDIVLRKRPMDCAMFAKTQILFIKQRFRNVKNGVICAID